MRRVRWLSADKMRLHLRNAKRPASVYNFMATMHIPCAVPYIIDIWYFRAPYSKGMVNKYGYEDEKQYKMRNFCASRYH